MTREELYGQMGQTLVGSMDSEIRFKEGVKVELQKIARQEYVDNQKKMKEVAADIYDKMSKRQFMQNVTMPGTQATPSAPTLPQAPYIAPWTPGTQAIPGATTRQDYDLTEDERKILSEYQSGIRTKENTPEYIRNLIQKPSWEEQYKWAALDVNKAALQQRKDLQTQKWASLDYLTKTAVLNATDKRYDNFSKTAQFQKLDVSQREQVYKTFLTEVGDLYGVDTEAIQGAFEDPTWEAKIWEKLGGTAKPIIKTAPKPTDGKDIYGYTVGEIKTTSAGTFRYTGNGQWEKIK